MAIARIIMNELVSIEATETFIKGHREQVKNGFLQIADFSVAVRTGETSLLIVTVYKDQETCDSNKDQRVLWFKEHDHLMKDDFFYEGEVETLLNGSDSTQIALELLRKL